MVPGEIMTDGRKSKFKLIFAAAKQDALDTFT